MTTNSTASTQRSSTPFIILFVLGAIVLVGLLLLVSLRLAIWIGTLLLLTFIVLLAGRVFTGNWLGILIDERKKMSLSRFQTVLWSVLILSAFLAAAIANLLVANNATGALSISIPPELLGILGISVTSLAGAPLVLNSKKGPIDRNKGKEPSDMPRWSDMVKGDDVANANYLDLSKVQMFYFTIILVLAYGAALVAMFMLADHRHSTIGEFPALNATTVGLFGISNAGYLVYKAVPRVLPPDMSQAPAGQTTPADQTPAASSVSPDPQAPQTPA